jgi:hypothetical protein
MGREGVPLWIADHAHPDPAALIEAGRNASFASSDDDLYPGIRAPAPADWAGWLAGALAVWPQLTGAAILRADYAIASQDPATLSPVQRIPHFDTTDPMVHAVIHYLCEAPHRGTSFHRHRRTGFERITPARAPLWRQALVADSARYGLPGSRYHQDDTASFERIGMAALRFNRLVVYPANCLHCGDIAETWARGDRLTITALIKLGSD